MRANWTADARLYIADATKDLPETATITERRAALSKVGSLFHMGTSWGKKVWTKECRRYLEQHGLPKRKPVDTKQPRLLAALERGDIIFPFRGE